jgi:hypothetical protein
MSDRAPAYRDPVLHFDALRLVALREGGRSRKPSQQGSREGCLYAHLCTCTQPTQLFAAGASLHPSPSLLCDLHPSCLASCSMFLGSNS